MHLFGEKFVYSVSYLCVILSLRIDFFENLFLKIASPLSPLPTYPAVSQPTSATHPNYPLLCLSQSDQRISRCLPASVGCTAGSLPVRTSRSRGCRPLRPVRRRSSGQRCLRLHGENLGRADRAVPTHADRTYQPRV